MFLFNYGQYISNDFVDTDNADTYEQNLKTLDTDWHYRNKKISYNLNSSKYRTDEWDTIDWNNSIVVFGCSIVFGTGLAEDELLSHFLEKYTGIPTINMGINGSSIYFSYMNQLKLIEQEFNPLAVVNIWTDIYRLTYFGKLGNINLGHWTTEENNLKNLYASWNFNDRHPRQYAKMIQQSAKMLWKNTQYYESTFYQDTAETFNIEHLPFLDHARDLKHPGYKSMDNAAKNIAKNLTF